MSDRTVERRAFGRALAAALSDAGLSRKDLSERLPASLSTISEWITGESEPSKPEVAFALEEKLGVAVGALSAHLGYVSVGHLTVDDLLAEIAASELPLRIKLAMKLIIEECRS